jgi:hypothetical protein
LASFVFLPGFAAASRTAADIHKLWIQSSQARQAGLQMASSGCQDLNNSGWYLNMDLESAPGLKQIDSNSASIRYPVHLVLQRPFGRDTF